jgi:hypothetical protein
MPEDETGYTRGAGQLAVDAFVPAGRATPPEVRLKPVKDSAACLAVPLAL